MAKHSKAQINYIRQQLRLRSIKSWRIPRTRPQVLGLLWILCNRINPDNPELPYRAATKSLSRYTPAIHNPPSSPESGVGYAEDSPTVQNTVHVQDIVHVQDHGHPGDSPTIGKEEGLPDLTGGD